MKKKLLFCGLLCNLSLSGWGKRALLEEKLDAEEIDKVVVTMAMGNPAYGAECSQALLQVCQGLAFRQTHTPREDAPDGEARRCLRRGRLLIYAVLSFESPYGTCRTNRIMKQTCVGFADKNRTV